MSDIQLTNETTSHLYEIAQIPGKGRGLLACVAIPSGTRIICERPLLTTTPQPTKPQTERSIATALKALSKQQQREFLSLHNNYINQPHPFCNIVKTNALPCGPGSEIGGIYLTICLINHSCLSNTHHSWNSKLGCETIHAVRDIHTGEEITICYDCGESSQPRRTFLKESFGFDCTCPLCLSPPSRITESDARRTQIRLLDGAIGDPSRVMSRPEACLADCQTLVRILNEEYGCTSVLLARLYYDAFQIAITHGDQARARVFAERGYGVRVVCEGEDSPETLGLKRFAEKPPSHRNFGASSRWSTKIGMAPKGLDEGAFEKWLWKEGR